jgi:L-amino acid N-acyltransferase YncA
MPSVFATQISIELMNDTDWPVVREIYVEGIRTGNATFETQPPAWDRWDASHLKSCRFVAVSQNDASHETAASRGACEVVGWAALSPVSNRCVYGGVAEVSVYIAERARGRKIGSALLAALVEASERGGIWTLQARIFPENVASVALHKRFGFRVVGTRECIGQMNGRWRDTVLLERRSWTVGV